MSRCGTRRIRCDAPVVTGKGTLRMTGMFDGGEVVDTMAGTWGVLVVASAPPERRLRNIWVRPVEMGRLWEIDGCRPGAALDRRLLDEGPGEGGEVTR